MKTGIIHVACAPIRKEADDRSEMVNQLLFGEGVRIMEVKKNWTRVRSLWDDYPGWMDTKQWAEADESWFKAGENIPILGDLFSMAIDQNQEFTPLVLGSSLTHLKGNELFWKNERFQIDGEILSPRIDRNALIHFAKLYLNAPYLWGGRTPLGIDCSGFTQMVYRSAGIRLKRDASQQAKQGHTLSFIEEAQAGDLAFFDNDEGRIIHVGIMLEGHKIMHAAGKVRIDKIDHQGIFNVDTGLHTHKLRLITNIIDD